MPMTPKGWSISALAVELNMDRRTVAARLRDVPPSGTERGHAVWRLPDAVAAVYRQGLPERVPAPPEWCSVIADVQPPWRGAVAATLAAIYKVSGISHRAAIEAGLSEEQADTLAAGITLGVVMHSEREFREAGVEPFVTSPEGEVEWIHRDYLWWQPKGGGEGPSIS